MSYYVKPEMNATLFCLVLAAKTSVFESEDPLLAYQKSGGDPAKYLNTARLYKGAWVKMSLIYAVFIMASTGKVEMLIKHGADVNIHPFGWPDIMIRGLTYAAAEEKLLLFLKHGFKVKPEHLEFAKEKQAANKDGEKGYKTLISTMETLLE